MAFTWDTLLLSMAEENQKDTGRSLSRTAARVDICRSRAPGRTALIMQHSFANNPGYLYVPPPLSCLRATPL